MINLAVAVMAYGGQITVYQAFTWAGLGSALRDAPNLKLIGFQHWDINPVDRARNMALASAMAYGADWLLMIDADVFVPSPTAGKVLINMITDAAEAGFDVVAAPVMSRAFQNPHLMAYVDSEGGLRAINRSDAKPGLVPIDAASTAIMAINLHSLNDSVQFRFVEATADNPWLSEDIAFCRQMRALGKKIACDTRVMTGHMGRSVPVYSDRTHR